MSPTSRAVILMEVPGLPGDSTVAGFRNQIVCHSFSMGVERELAATVVNNGTTGLNLGVGELQGVTLTKSLDLSSTRLFQLSASGGSVPSVTLRFISLTNGTSGDKPKVWMLLRMEPAVIQSWHTRGDKDTRPEEAIAIWYNKLSLQTLLPNAKGEILSQPVGWDQTMDIPWFPSVDIRDAPDLRPLVTGITSLSGGALRIQFGGVPGARYSIDFTASLTAPRAWTSLGTVQADFQGMFEWIDSPTAPMPEARFYRATRL